MVTYHDANDVGCQSFSLDRIYNALFKSAGENEYKEGGGDELKR